MNEENEINGTNTANEVNKQEGYVKKRIIDIVAASKWALAIIGFSVVLLGFRSLDLKPASITGRMSPFSFFIAGEVCTS